MLSLAVVVGRDSCGLRGCIQVSLLTWRKSVYADQTQRHCVIFKLWHGKSGELVIVVIFMTAVVCEGSLSLSPLEVG
jgi:hypothetical protein